MQVEAAAPNDDDDVDIAEILLGVHHSPALTAQPAPKRPRFDSEFSLGGCGHVRVGNPIPARWTPSKCICV